MSTFFPWKYKRLLAFAVAWTSAAATVFVLANGAQWNDRSINSEKEWIEVTIPKCGCSKLVPRLDPSSDGHDPPTDDTEYTERNGTCEGSTWARGFGQKVVAFSFFEPMSKKEAKRDGVKGLERREDMIRRNYFTGIRENLRLMKQFYPGWVMRLYYHTKDATPSTVSGLCDLACADPSLDLCDAADNPRLGDMQILHPQMWRFTPAVDVQVDAFLVRDLDSRINAREAAAVSEFITNSRNKFVHVMRDHPAHGAYIMAGMWGARLDNAEVRRRFLVAFTDMFQDPVSYVSGWQGGWDQIALTRYVWQWSKRFAMSHDSYTCRKFPDTTAFPTKRESGVGNYVGSVVSLGAELDISDESGGAVCPIKCRPREHKDWKFC